MEEKPSLQKILDEAAFYAESGDMEQAIQLFQQAVRVQPHHAAAHDMLAQCLMETAQHDAAYKSACAACDLDPDAPAFFVTLGRAARNCGRLKQAASALQDALAVQQGAVQGRAASEGAVQVDVQGVLQELAEVQELLVQQVGHAVGLPGLQIWEAPLSSDVGPGGVVWDSGILLARLITQHQASPVSHSQAHTQHTCCSSRPSSSRWPSSTSADASALHPGHDIGSRSGESLGESAARITGEGVVAEPVPLPDSQTTVPLQGSNPTFQLPPEATQQLHSEPSQEGPILGPTRICLTGRVTQQGKHLHADDLAQMEAARKLDEQCKLRRSLGGLSAEGLLGEIGSFLAASSVLELGSGTGVVGIAAACSGAHVVATDRAGVLPLLRGNVQLNAAQIQAAGGSVRVMEYDWGETFLAQACRGGGDSEEGGLESRAGAHSADGTSWRAGGNFPPDLSFEWVLGADLVYAAAGVPALVISLAGLIKEGADFLRQHAQGSTSEAGGASIGPHFAASGEDTCGGQRQELGSSLGGGGSSCHTLQPLHSHADAERHASDTSPSPAVADRGKVIVQEARHPAGQKSSLVGVAARGGRGAQVNVCGAFHASCCWPTSTAMRRWTPRFWRG